MNKGCVRKKRQWHHGKNASHKYMYCVERPADSTWNPESGASLGCQEWKLDLDQKQEFSLYGNHSSGFFGAAIELCKPFEQQTPSDCVLAFCQDSDRVEVQTVERVSGGIHRSGSGELYCNLGSKAMGMMSNTKGGRLGNMNKTSSLIDSAGQRIRGSGQAGFCRQERCRPEYQGF